MCTDFLLTATDGSVVNGRSMEYGANLGSQILVGGVGTVKTSTAPKPGGGREPGMTWTATYGYVGMNAAGLRDGYGDLLKNMITDGMNSAGLAISALWLPTSTKYPPVTNSSTALYVADFANWVLGTCRTVGDVVDALGSVQVWCDVDIKSKPYIPVHFSVHDADYGANGNSIVIEFLDGNPPSVQGNPVGVMTNEPPFAWHLSNIGNYINLTATDAPPITVRGPYGASYVQNGHGSGMLGLPGDSTPPSRFIRALFEKQFATPPASGADACSLALHLLNTVDIPLGTSRPQDAREGDDYTQWAVVKSLSSTGGTFSYRTYDNPTICQVNLAAPNLFSTAREESYPLPAPPSFIDVTAGLTPS